MGNFSIWTDPTVPSIPYCRCCLLEATTIRSIPQREREAYKRDAFKLYPHNYLLPDGRIYLTREGDFNSLRNENASCIRQTKYTYFLTVNGNTAKDTRVAFTRGPDRPEFVTSSGTTVLDPNTNNQAILLTGGMNITTGGSNVNTSSGSQYAGSRGSRKLEVYTLPNSTYQNGTWKMANTTFLGDHDSDDRTMHYAIILPTKQILVINGGNYDFAAPVYYPLLLTPVYLKSTFTGTYNKTRLAKSSNPRLYHNIALLLRDGRVLIAGGNPCRASVDQNQSLGVKSSQAFGQMAPNLSRVQRNLYFLTDIVPWLQILIKHHQPRTGSWKYSRLLTCMFIDGARRTQIESIAWIPQNSSNNRSSLYQSVSVVGSQKYYLLHSNYRYNVSLIDLPASTLCSVASGSLVLMKLGSATHGWDARQKLYKLDFSVVDFDVSGKTTTAVMQFDAPDAASANLAPAFYMLYYVDCRGKPSPSAMVRFDDKADSAVTNLSDMIPNAVNPVSGSSMHPMPPMQILLLLFVCFTMWIAAEIQPLGYGEI